MLPRVAAGASHPAVLRKSSRPATISTDTDRRRLCANTQRTGPATKGARVCDQFCSARKTPAAFCLSLLARNERGESRRVGEIDKQGLLSPALSSFWRRRGRENAVRRSKQIFFGTQLLGDPQERCQSPSVFTNPMGPAPAMGCGSQSRPPQNRRGLR